MKFWLLWYLVTTISGLLIFPAVYRLLPGLKDRGYTISRILGWLIWGYSFWLLASIGAIPFDIGGLVLSGFVLVGLAVWGWVGTSAGEIKAWLQQNKRVVLVNEILFLTAFLGWSIFRAANPEAIGTEKPMELAFINAILRSVTFPPHDPWLSGYAISYYYFGYVLVAILAKFTGTSGSVAFNLGVALVFALSACGSYGLVFNMLNGRFAQIKVKPKTPNFAIASLLAPLFVLIASNLEGFLEVLNTRGILWARAVDGALQSSFWRWLDIQDLSNAPQEPYSWIPTRFWWWWRASRVLQDYDLRGATKEIIDEFPFFSYLLSDLHPHVLAMPFAFLAASLALNVVFSKKVDRSWIHCFLNKNIDLRINPGLFLLTAITAGGMAFLNTWDFPVYVFIFSAAYTIASARSQPEKISATALRFIGMGLALGISGILLYLPFYFGFASQAGGLLPNLIYPTRGAHLWVMFGVLLVPLFINLLHLQNLKQGVASSLSGFAAASGIMLGAWALSIVLAWMITQVPGRGQLFLSTLGAESFAQLFQAAISRRLMAVGGWLTLLLMLGLILGLVKRVLSNTLSGIFSVNNHENNPPLTSEKLLHKADVFQLILVFTGLLLVLTPEFFYLLDMFGWRMNTIFKFYFQAWLLWGVAAAFATVRLSHMLSGLKRQFSLAVIYGVLFASLAYPILGIWSKTNGFQPGVWTLDSSAYFARSSPDEMAAIQWLQSAPMGAVAEAVPDTGGSYTEYARVSILSGLPGVLGWVGHENQWRGGGEAMGTRLDDLKRLYCSRNWDEVYSILNQYNIRYIFVGNLERVTYRPDSTACPYGLIDAKFKKNLPLVFQSNQIAVYENIDLKP